MCRLEPATYTNCEGLWSCGLRHHSGEILTLEQTLECAKYGVMVKAEVEWSTTLLEGKRGQLHVSEVRDSLLHILNGKESNKPGWLTLTVRGFHSPSEPFAADARWHHP